jgi:hypothetical protein
LGVLNGGAGRDSYNYQLQTTPVVNQALLHLDFNSSAATLLISNVIFFPHLFRRKLLNEHGRMKLRPWSWYIKWPGHHRYLINSKKSVFVLTFSRLLVHHHFKG